MKRIRFVALAVLIVGSGLIFQVVRAQAPGLKRTDLQRHELSIPGRELFQVLVEIEPGTPFFRHSHPGEEIIYVVSGELEYEVEGRPNVTLKAGEVLFIPYGKIHAARSGGNSKGAELATYVVEKGKPLVVPAK